MCKIIVFNIFYSEEIAEACYIIHVWFRQI